MNNIELEGILSKLKNSNVLLVGIPNFVNEKDGDVFGYDALVSVKKINASSISSRCL